MFSICKLFKQLTGSPALRMVGDVGSAKGLAFFTLSVSGTQVPHRVRVGFPSRRLVERRHG